jgi:hypothetical protein
MGRKAAHSRSEARGAGCEGRSRSNRRESIRSKQTRSKPEARCFGLVEPPSRPVPTRAVKRARAKRIADFGPIPAPDHLDADSDTFDQDYAAYMATTTQAIADGTYQSPEPKQITRQRDVIRELGHIGRAVPDA